MPERIRYFQHQCDLHTSSEKNLLELPPYLPRYKRWFKNLRRLCEIDENSRRTREFFRSYAAVRAEKRRHDSRYFLTIHPFSKVTVYRERFLLLLWTLNYIIDPLTWAFVAVIDFHHPLLHYQVCMDFLFFLNVMITSFIGYIDESTKEIVLCRRKIFRHVVFWYIIPELLGCFPFLVIILDIVEVDTKKSRLQSFACIRMFRLLRLPDVFTYLNNLFREMNIREWFYIWFVMFLANFYIILWTACGLFFIDVLVYTYDGLPKGSFLLNRPADYPTGGTDTIAPHNSFNATFITLLMITACHFYGASEGYLAIETNLEKVLCSIILILGYISCTFITAKLLEIHVSSNISTTKYDEFMRQVSEYGRSKNLPLALMKRLDIYHEYKFHRRYFKEEFILSTLSQHLRSEMTLYGCRNVLEKVPLFQGMSKGVVGSILGYMKREIYLPNDVVIKYGEPLVKMFWVSFGTLSVHYGPKVIEILHFEDGDHFGDRSITRGGGNANLTVVSLEITEIFTLTREDVKHCTAFLREMTNKISKIAEEKRRIYTMLAEMMGEEENRNTVLADLRKGRILERDRFRIAR